MLNEEWKKTEQTFELIWIKLKADSDAESLEFPIDAGRIETTFML